MEAPTRERYRALLARIYSFEAPVEHAVIATAGIERDLLRTHLKTERLVADLEALELDPRDVTPTYALQFRSAPEALGWLWVVHRNTLLHGLLYRYLQTKLPDSMRAAGSYLSAFEGRAGALMRTLGNALGAAATRPTIMERTVKAANDAFRMQRQWYSCDVLSARRPPTLPPRTRASSQAA
jgi:heme oxygenase